MKIRFTPEAAQELIEAWVWYDEYQDGLGEEFQHSFDSPTKCSCRSRRSAAITTEAFSGHSPTGPLVQFVEDAFSRPDTTKPITGGDGLGPTTVWQEIASNEGAAGRARIIQNARAELEQGVFGWFVAGSSSRTTLSSPTRSHVVAEPVHDDLKVACAQYCSTSNHPVGDIEDTFDTYALSGVYGTWGFFVHHNSYYLDHFRAGSEP